MTPWSQALRSPKKARKGGLPLSSLDLKSQRGLATSENRHLSERHHGPPGGWRHHVKVELEKERWGMGHVQEQLRRLTGHKQKGWWRGGN